VSDSVVEAFLAIGAIFVLAAAGASPRIWGSHVGAIKDVRWRLPVFVVGLVLLAVSGVGAFSRTGPTPTPTPSPSMASTTTDSASPAVSGSSDATASTDAAAAPTSGPGSVARQGRLTVRAYVAVDLDSAAADWGAVKGSWDNVRDLEWDGPGKDTFSVTGGWANVAVLGSTAPSDYVACSTAQMGTDPEAGNGFHVGERICVQTGRHLVLLAVAAVNASVNGSPATLVMNATVWND